MKFRKFRAILLRIMILLAFIGILSLPILFFVKGCQGKNFFSDDTAPMKINDKIEMKTISNETVTFQKTETGFKNLDNEKIVLINFFTTKCAPCNAMIPHLNNLQRKYEENLTVVSVLLETGVSQDEIDDFRDKNGVDYTITFDKKNLLFSAEHGNITNIPNMFIYDKNGELLENYIGIIPEEMIEADLVRMF